MFTAGDLIVGYNLRFLALEDNTTVTVKYEESNDIYHLNRSEFIEIIGPTNDKVTIVSCGRKCLAMQYSTTRVDYAIGNFMFNILDLESQFTTTARFTTLDITTITGHYISIVAYFEVNPDTEQIRLDGKSLGDLTWQLRNPYVYTELDVEPGVHVVDTTAADIRLSVYVYGHTNASGGGYGYPVYPQGKMVISNS